MGVSESILRRTIECCEGVCEDVDCEIDSGCCKTHYVNNHKKKQDDDTEKQEKQISLNQK
jgi:hypothetical protein